MTEAIEFLLAGEEKSRLDNALLPHVQALRPGISRSQIRKWIEGGLAEVAGSVVHKAGTSVLPGQSVRIELPTVEPSALEPFSFPLKILYEDEDLLAIDKPPGLSMHPGAGNRTETLANALVGHYGDLPGAKFRPGIVHRLDKDTSGVVVVAKSVEAHASLSRQFAARTVDRAYLAVLLALPRVRGPIRLRDSGRVDQPIGRHPQKRTLFAVGGVAAKPARTNWRVLERFSYGALVELRLDTGRTHQIRVHLDSIGSPVVGDKMYGDFSALSKPLQLAADRFGRQALHAFKLGFEHPRSGAKLAFESPLPTDMQELIAAFRRDDG